VLRVSECRIRVDPFRTAEEQQFRSFEEVVVVICRRPKCAPAQAENPDSSSVLLVQRIVHHASRHVAGMQVAEGIYLGDISSLALVRAGATQYNIAAVVSLLSGPQDAYRELDGIPPSVHRHYVAIDDTSDTCILRGLHATLAFIHRHARPPERNVLVHCFAGESRSAAVVLAYMLATAPVPSLDNALTALREKHPPAAPNPAFTRQLLVLEAFCRDERTRGSLSDKSRDMVSLERGFFPPHMDLNRLSWLSDCSRLLILEESLHVLAAAKARGRQTCPPDVFLPMSNRRASTDRFQLSQSPRNLYSARCRSCRIVLASSLHILRGRVLRDSTVPVAPLVWMKAAAEVLLVNAGVSRKGERLRCPYCDTKVGACGWQGEGTDSAGEHSPAAPYFRLNNSAVDWMAEQSPSHSDAVDLRPPTSN
jgi:hypothetical protein